MAQKRRPRRRIALFALGFAWVGSTASLAMADDGIAKYQPQNFLRQVGYNTGADCGCTSPAPSCGNNYNPTGLPPAVSPRSPDMNSLPPAPTVEPNPMAAPNPMLNADGDLSPSDIDMDMPQLPERDLNAPLVPSPMLAASFGASAGGFSSTPNTIGDFFGGGLNLGSNFAFQPPFNTGMEQGDHHQEFASAPIHGGDRLLKITEFNSPIPVDRVFFTYNHFHNAIQESIDGGVVDRNLNRCVLGLEKTFNSGNSSVELRLPFVAGLDAVQNTSDSISEEAVLFGDIVLAVKTILLTTERTIYSGGLGVSLPTGPNAEITFLGETLFLDNEAVHLSPYLGALHRPNDRLFLQGFLQFNFDLNGNGYSATTGASGVIQDQTLMFLSGTIGYWMYQNQQTESYITGIAPVLELHYTSTMNDADTDGAGGSTILVNDGANRIDVLNLTAGTHIQLGPLSTLTTAVIVPLKDGEGKLFDAEASVLFNRRF